METGLTVDLEACIFQCERKGDVKIFERDVIHLVLK